MKHYSDNTCTTMGLDTDVSKCALHMYIYISGLNFAISLQFVDLLLTIHIIGHIVTRYIARIIGL